jgi:hypothetical protein
MNAGPQVVNTSILTISGICYVHILVSLFVFSDPPGFETEDELISYYDSLNDTYQDTYAVVFEGLPAKGDPDNFKYKIRLSDPRLQTSRLFPEFETNGPGSSGTVYEY